MKILLSVILFSFLSIRYILAQDYYPLQVGNTWYLGEYPYQIIGSKIINNKEYFITLDSIYQRVDENGDVLFRINDTTEYIEYKLNAKIGETWENQLDRNGYSILRYITLESNNEIIHTADTAFINCYRYSIHYKYISDADYSIYLAPNVGIVKDSSLDWGLASSLVKSKINGKRIPSKVILPKIIETIPQNNQNVKSFLSFLS